jgi:hypothetical protein
MFNARAACRLPIALLVASATLLALVPGTGASGLPSPSALVTDGPVRAQVIDSSGRLYLGGEFLRVGPRLGSGLSLNTGSDAPAAGFPDINGPVLASATDGAGGEFIGGSFTAVGGVTRNRLAHSRRRARDSVRCIRRLALSAALIDAASYL